MQDGETIERPDNWEGRPYAREDGWTDDHRAFRDWLMNELVLAGCEVRTLSPIGMAQVTVEHMVRQSWIAAPTGSQEFQWGVRTTYTDGSQGTDWTNEDDASSFLVHYAEYDAAPAMHVQTRELVRRPVVAGDVEVIESSYAERRAAAAQRLGARRS